MNSISIVKYLSSRVQEGRRRIKALVLGLDDGQESYEAMPFGDDGRPPDGFKAVHSQTNEKGKTVIIGYINTNQLESLGVGEKRIYSTSESGELQAFMVFRNDGTIEVLGTGDNMIRYAPLDTALQSLATDIQAELTKIATGIASAGGSYTPGSINIDISGARIDEVKTP